MKHLLLCALFVLALAVDSAVGTTGTLGLEAGIIAAIIVCVATIISVGIGIGVCLYRNDLCPYFQKSYIRAEA